MKDVDFYVNNSAKIREMLEKNPFIRIIKIPFVGICMEILSEMNGDKNFAQRNYWSLRKFLDMEENQRSMELSKIDQLADFLQMPILACCKDELMLHSLSFIY